MGLHDIHWFKYGMCSRQYWLLPLFYSWELAEQEEAKEICSRCPVITQCLAHANANHEEGIWGGMTSKEREEALITSTFREVLLIVERRNTQREQLHLQYASHEPLSDISFPQIHNPQALWKEAAELMEHPLDQLASLLPRSPLEFPSDPNQTPHYEPYPVEYESPQLQIHQPSLERGEAPSALDLSFFQNEAEYTSDLVA